MGQRAVKIALQFVNESPLIIAVYEAFQVVGKSSHKLYGNLHFKKNLCHSQFGLSQFS
jgi:hypothetical protein